MAESAHILWRQTIFQRMIRLAYVWEADNFDAYRYRGQSPKLVLVDQHAAYLAFLVDNAAEYFRSRQILADEESRDLFDLLILYRLLGHMHVRLPLSNPQRLAALKVPDDWKISDTADQTAFGPISVWCVPVGDETVWVSGVDANVAAYLARQYYFDRNDESIAPTNGDFVIDAGGCFGDTALFFANRVGPRGRVYTFDPLAKHCQIMRDAFKLNAALEDRIALFPVGLADVDEDGSATSGNEINPGARVGTGSGLSLRTIDSLVRDGTIEKVDFIKMDIEGSELDALRGAEHALRTWRPKLAISIYHRPEDFFTIPLWIDSLDIGYRFFLDHYSIHNEETVLYAIAEPTALGAPSTFA